MLLYISGSFYAGKEGIADGAYILWKAFAKINPHLVLLTSDIPEIRDLAKSEIPHPVYYMKKWNFFCGNTLKLWNILKNEKITCIHMEYPGDGYGKTLFPSFIPFLVRLYNLLFGKQIRFNIRLHEFTQARFIRKAAIIPLVLFAHNVYIPALHDRTRLEKIFGSKIKSTVIGTNIFVPEKTLEKTSDLINIAYFGSVYPGKGIERLLKIWKTIKENDKEGIFCFTIIGEINPNNENHFSEYHKKIYVMLEQYGLKNSIRITGYIEDDQVSKEMFQTDIAMLLYEDGLTLRRGSFIAFLLHEVPVITVEGDLEAKALLKDIKSVYMSKTDEDIINVVNEWKNVDRKELTKYNYKLKKYFDWNNIATTFLAEYGELYLHEPL